jgi:hypothetical protein
MRWSMICMTEIAHCNLSLLCCQIGLPRDCIERCWKIKASAAVERRILAGDEEVGVDEEGSNYVDHETGSLTYLMDERRLPCPQEDCALRTALLMLRRRMDCA